MGKTPREFGALHVHFEGVDPVDRGLVVARVLVQGAFDPMPAAVSRVSFFSGEKPLGEFPLPALTKGEAVRLSWPLRAPADATQFNVFVHAIDAAASAERIRPAWKLFDTIEQAKEAPRANSDVGLNLGASLIGTAMLGGAGFVLVGNLRGDVVGNAEPRKVHAARELPSFLTVELGANTVPPQDATVEVLWAPGQQLPQVAPLVIKQQATEARTVRTCRQCDFEDRHDEYARATMCPRCDAIWP
ncbi:MAG: hypothetical protein U0228_35575 [Myxococcaceae bacterium]